jgi:hypothetical protein
MDLLRVCKDVRGVPRSCRRTGPARQSAMGVAAVNARDTACLHGFHSVWFAQDPSQRMIPSSHAVRMSQAAWQTARAETARLSRLDSAHGAGFALTRRKGFPPVRHRAFHPGVTWHPQAQTPRANAQNMDVMVVSSRKLPSQDCGVRAPRRRMNTQRLEPDRCTDYALQFLFLFPQGSRHLPFPFSNARVEVGRTVMEG